jgi:acyl dehydratase
MEKGAKIGYLQLEPGYRLPPTSYRLEPAMVAQYLAAVEEPSSIYQDNLVPPMAIAAYAMSALSDNIELPPGVIHTHGELKFLQAVNTGETITCHSCVSQKLERGGLHLLTIDSSVFNQKEEKVLAGKTSFILPKLNKEGKEG